MTQQPDLRRIFLAASRMDAGQARQVITLAIKALEAPQQSEGDKHYARRKKFIDRMKGSVERVVNYARHETLRKIEKHFRDNPPIKGAAKDPEKKPLAKRLTFDKAQLEEELLAALREDSAQALTTAGQTVFDELQNDNPWTMPAEDAISFLDRRKNLLASVPGEIQDEISAAIQDGLEKGETRRQLMERIASKFDGISKARAETIANTETAAAFNYARDKAMRAAGVTHKKWLHSKSPLIKEPRPTHVAADGQVQPIDEPFDIGGVSMMRPGDESAGPEEIINCHCVALPVEAPVKSAGEKEGHPFRGNQYTKFHGILKLASDSPEKLRSSDVDRVMSEVDPDEIESFKSFLLRHKFNDPNTEIEIREWQP